MLAGVACTFDEDGNALSDERVREILRIGNEERKSVLHTADLSGGMERCPVPVFNYIDHTRIYPNFKYSITNFYGKNQPRSEVRPTCKCNGKCHKHSCSCIRASSIKINDGKIMNQEQVMSHPMNFILVECSSECGCKGRCSNKYTSKQVPLRCELDYFENKGFGVRIRELGKVGTFFCEFVGEIVTGHERDNIIYQFAIDSGDGQQHNFIDAKEVSNIARFINHSCDPCLTPFKFIREKMSTDRLPHLGFFFNRDMLPGDEVTLSYGTAYWNSLDLYCHCLTSACEKPPPEYAKKIKQIKKWEKQMKSTKEKKAAEIRLCDIRKRAVKNGMPVEEALKIGKKKHRRKPKMYLPTHSHTDGPLLGPTIEVVEISSSSEEYEDDDDDDDGEDEEQPGPSGFNYTNSHEFSEATNVPEPICNPEGASVPKRPRLEKQSSPPVMKSPDVITLDDD